MIYSDRCWPCQTGKESALGLLDAYVHHAEVAGGQKRNCFPNVSFGHHLAAGTIETLRAISTALQQGEYIWLARSGELTQQSTLFRFTYMIETLRAMDWIDWLVSAKEWEEKAKLAGNVCAIYTPKDKLHQVFSSTGELIRPMELWLTGDISGIPALIAKCNLNACLMTRDFSCQQRVKSDPLTVTTNGLILIHLVYSGLASAITPAFRFCFSR
ncbi:DUF2913 family protein, partial [Serratia rhizosphaerae]|nr:DUF2913 family protein [Serratia rhizosphaerae]